MGQRPARGIVLLLLHPLSSSRHLGLGLFLSKTKFILQTRLPYRQFMVGELAQVRLACALYRWFHLDSRGLFSSWTTLVMFATRHGG